MLPPRPSTLRHAAAAAADSSSSSQANGLTGRTAAEILWRLFATDRRHSQLVSGFSSLSSLEGEFTFLQSLKTEADQARAEQERTQELQKAQMHAAEGRQTRFDPSVTNSSAGHEKRRSRAFQSDFARSGFGGIRTEFVVSTEDFYDPKDMVRARPTLRQDLQADGLASAWASAWHRLRFFLRS